MYFADALIMDRTWDAPGGFLGFSARFARTGIQMYDGSEIDPEGEHKLADGTRRFNPGTLYPVDRPAEEVFSNRALASFIAKPLTNDHPTQGVDIDNWRELTGGVIGETLRDGEYARLSGLMTDKALIADYRAGKKELSGGYSAKLVIGDGVNAKGEPFVAKQTEIDGNHVAFVQRGRAGSECRVVDAAPCAAAPSTILNDLKTEKPVKTMLIDGLTVDMANADTAIATATTLRDARNAANAKVTDLEAKLATLTTEKTTLDAKVVTLEQAVKDAKPTPQQLRDAGKALMLTAGKAKALGVTVTDEMDETAIVKAVVDAKVKAELRQGWNDGQYAASFAVLADGVKTVTDTGVQPINTPIIANDAAAIRDRVKRARNA